MTPKAIPDAHKNPSRLPLIMLYRSTIAKSGPGRISAPSCKVIMARKILYIYSTYGWLEIMFINLV